MQNGRLKAYLVDLHRQAASCKQTSMDPHCKACHATTLATCAEKLGMGQSSGPHKDVKAGLLGIGSGDAHHEGMHRVK